MGAIKDAQSYFDGYQSDYVAITGNGNSDGAAFDTASHQMGITFLMGVAAYTDGDYELVIQDSADGSTDWQDVAAAKLLPQPGTAAVTLGAVTSDGDMLAKAGCFSTRRYVRARVTATSVTSGATVYVVIIKHGEYLPL